MATATNSTIIGLFANRAAAEHAVEALIANGYSREHVSILASDSRLGTDAPDLGPIDDVGSGTDAGTGAAIGGVAGFIGGIIALAIPGIGPIIAAGPLAAAIMGAGIGAATGGVVGALKDHGVPEEDASRFNEALRSGHALVSAHVSSDHADKVSDLLEDNGAIDVDDPAGEVPADSGLKLPPAPPRSSRPMSSETAARELKLKPGDSLMERERDRERRVYVFPGITGGGSMPNS